MTGEQVRWGLENLALDQKKLDALGFAGVMRPITTSCADHMGSTWARIQTWDGSKWSFTSDWFQADEQIIKPMVKAAADKYVTEKKLHAPQRLRIARPDGALCDGGRCAGRSIGRAGARPDPSRRQRHRGDLQPRDPRAEGRVAAGARGQDRRAAWAATAPARRRRCAR